MPGTNKDRTVVIVSSTARDLPEHRKEVMDACLRQGMFPVMMEHLPASDAEAISASLKLVDEADIYIGIFAHRYGYVPKDNNPRQISVTEMEFDRAVEHKIPRLIFVIDKTHPITIDDVEQGEGAVKLAAFKERLQTENIVNFFKSPVDLRAHVINSLSQHRQPDLTTFHYVSDIPAPPEAFIAHPYTLLQTHRLVGRQPELNLLTDWVAKPDSQIYKAHILNVIAIGGMGKSALTWKWFNDIAPQEMKPLAGRMWWSFYESDATFENFVTRALAYVSHRPLDEVQQIPAPDREAQLLAALDREPYLFVLDGLERILIAYARMDAAHLSDDDYDKQTANFVANAYGLPASAAQSFTGEHRLRKTADPRAGAFLRKLANVRAARILVSMRLYPADLQTVTSDPLPGCSAIFLPGLSDDDALELWRAFEVKGARDSLLPIFNRVGNHPLLIQALASEIARYRPAPRDFDQWLRDNPDFDPFSLPLVQVKSHVLEFALRGLDDKAQQVLRTIAAFRMPARYDTLASLLIGEGKPCADERELDGVLTELEDRGLVGWDKRANRYDLHPLVRGVVWSGLGDDARRGVYTSLHTHFEAVPMIDDFLKVNSLEDLTPAIELYNALIGLERYDDAGDIFYEQLSSAMLFRLGVSPQHIKLLEMLFTDGLDRLPRLSKPAAQAFMISALATGYQFSGQPGRAATLFCRNITFRSEMNLRPNSGTSLRNLSGALLLSGALRESEAATRSALHLIREERNRVLKVAHAWIGSEHNRHYEANSLELLGSSLAVRGIANEAKCALRRSLRIYMARPDTQVFEGGASLRLAQGAIWMGEFAAAVSFANRAWKRVQFWNNETALLSVSRVQGETALGLNDFATADERLYHALTRARIVNHVEEELPTLVALAELRRRQGDLKAARELLDDVWEVAERGPYPLFHADACNVLAQIERDAGEHGKAVEAAERAYRLAWCDGPPFAYHWGLKKARALLKELGAGEPEMPPFDASKFEPMPEVEIDPADEFGAGSGKDVESDV
jgi:tetratricopeptide (TPR) repeat protein